MKPENLRIILARLPMDNSYPERDKLAGFHCAPHTGMAILAKAVKKKVPDAEIRIYDSYNLRMDYIEGQMKKWKPHVVGATEQYTEHRNALRFLETGKNIGALTLAGGSNATSLAGRVPLNHAFVDGVVKGDGEDALSEIALRLSNGERFEDFRGHIPNLAYVKEGIAIDNKMMYAKMDILFDFDEMVDL